MKNQYQPQELEKILETLIEKKFNQELGKINNDLQAMKLLIDDATKKSAEKKKKLSIIVFNDDLDRLMSAMIIATTAATMNMPVSMYFTFWGINALKKKIIYRDKSLLEKAFTFLMPKNINKTTISQLNMLGFGTLAFKLQMRKKNVVTLSELMQLARDMKIKIIACQMTMNILGIVEEELIEGVSFGGSACYINELASAEATLFI